MFNEIRKTRHTRLDDHVTIDSLLTKAEDFVVSFCRRLVENQGYRTVCPAIQPIAGRRTDVCIAFPRIFMRKCMSRNRLKFEFGPPILFEPISIAPQSTFHYCLLQRIFLRFYRRWVTNSEIHIGYHSKHNQKFTLS